jgi:hypothetical protein
MRVPADLRKEVALARRKKWRLVLGGSGHLKWFDSNGKLRLVTAMTPSGGNRGTLNARAKLKKYGIIA